VISVAVMAHPARRTWAEDLAEQLDAQVVWDRWDDRIDTGERAIAAYHPAASHHLVVQDDAIICQDLVKGLEQAVEVSGDRLVGLYWMRTHPRTPMAKVQRQSRAKAWIAMDTIGGGVGILFPVSRIEELLTAYRAEAHEAYDIRVLRAARACGVEVWHTSPSLVDHRDERSLITGRSARPGRVASWFIGADASALEVDWSAGVHEVK